MYVCNMHVCLFAISDPGTDALHEEGSQYPGNERFFKNQVFTLYEYIGTIAAICWSENLVF